MLFNYASPYLDPDSNFDLSDHEVQSPDSDLQQGSESSGGMLSPVPGSTSWEPDLSEIELVKSQEGLGFSLLDFAVSACCCF